MRSVARNGIMLNPETAYQLKLFWVNLSITKHYILSISKQIGSVSDFFYLQARKLKWSTEFLWSYWWWPNSGILKHISVLENDKTILIKSAVFEMFGPFICYFNMP